MKTENISNSSRNLWRILNSKEKKWFAILSFMMLIGMLLEMVGISLAIPTIAILMNPERLSDYAIVEKIFLFLIGGQKLQKEFMVLSGLTLLLLMYLFKTFYLTFLTWTQAKFAYAVQRSVSKRIFSQYMRQEYSFHLQRNSAQLIQNVIGEVGLFTIAVQSQLILLTETLVLLGVSTLLLVIQPTGTIVIFSLIITFSLAYYYFTKKNVLKWGKERQVHEGYKIQHIQQGLGGIKDVKITGREELFIQNYDIHNVKAARIGALINTIQGIPRLWLDLLAITAIVALVFINLNIGTPLEAILPSVALFIAASFRLLPSGSRILNAFQTLDFSKAAVSKLYAEVSLPPPVEAKNYGDKITFGNSIDLQRVSFSYKDGSRPSIDNFFLSISKGEFIGIKGPSGSGKTTLLDLILGFLSPDHGIISVDGKDIMHNLGSWRQKIGYVPQDIFLTDSSIRENIAFGLPNDQVSQESLQNAAEMAQIGTFINELPDKFDTTLGERGIKISGGQKQRIGLARALYTNPEVLILDEATSALDTKTEKEVMKSILNLKRKKTIIAVAHRMSTLQDCDRIIEIQNLKVLNK
ncbi:ABC transporter ATP-binding protein/permease [Paracoccaceae bacterium]|nr:ABC transporter ATP-binding protein/permease [Paracoccaceae bacterium]